MGGGKSPLIYFSLFRLKTNGFIAIRQRLELDLEHANGQLPKNALPHKFRKCNKHFYNWYICLIFPESTDMHHSVMMSVSFGNQERNIGNRENRAKQLAASADSFLYKFVKNFQLRFSTPFVKCNAVNVSINIQTTPKLIRNKV